MSNDQYSVENLISRKKRRKNREKLSEDLEKVSANNCSFDRQVAISLTTIVYYSYLQSYKTIRMIQASKLRMQAALQSALQIIRRKERQ
jgi:hypothetical protein